MSNQQEQDTWEQEDVEIVDLGAPDRGLSRYIFTLGEKWQVVAPLRIRLFALLIAFCLLLAVLQPGSSGINTSTPTSPHAVPGYSLPSTIYLVDCGITINTNSLPANNFVWEQVMSTPSTQECSFFSQPANQCPLLQQLLSTPSTSQIVNILCSVGVPSPVPAGKNGKNR